MTRAFSGELSPSVRCEVFPFAAPPRRPQSSGYRAALIRLLGRRLLLGYLLLGSSVLGCGSAISAVRIASATDELARAEQLDAARKAPYEYQYALEHLREARAESARADYGDAAMLAIVAHDYARRAVEVAQRVEPAQPRSVPESP
jgi:hypothetical protein